MRVVLSTISQFHVYDTALQLERLQVLERLFTGQPRWRLRRQPTGRRLPLAKVDTYPYLQTPYELAARLGWAKKRLIGELNWQCHQSLDAHVGRHLPDCEIFHALVYCGLRSGREARRRSTAWVADANNAHLVLQDDLLAEEHERVGLPYQREDRRLLEYAEQTYASADVILVPSQYVKRTFCIKGVPEARVAVIPYGVDLHIFNPIGAVRKSHFRVIFVGSLSVLKGVHDLLRAFKLADISRSELLFIGTPQPETQELLGRDLPATVHILGPQTKQQLREHYAQADVLVLPSITDAWGLVISEAMACGCPVIATENSGGADLITDGSQGFVVPIRSPETIAEKLVWLYEHPAEREAMRQAARRRVEAIRGWDDYGDQILGLYQSLLKW